MTGLPIRNPDPAPRETLFSYLARLAATVSVLDGVRAGLIHGEPDLVGGALGESGGGGLFIHEPADPREVARGTRDRDGGCGSGHN